MPPTVRCKYYTLNTDLERFFSMLVLGTVSQTVPCLLLDNSSGMFHHDQQVAPKQHSSEGVFDPHCFSIQYHRTDCHVLT